MGKLYELWLAEAIRHGCDFTGETRLLGLHTTSTGVLASLQSGTRRRTASARFVIGADGARSRVARDLGLDHNQRFLVGVEDVYAGVPLNGPPRFDCVLDPVIAPGYLAWVVHDGEETHVGVAGESDRYDPAAALAEFTASASGRWDLSRGERVERRGGVVPVGGILRRIVCPRGLLVGDAAGAVSPLTAGGLDPAVRLSTLAARVTRAYLDGEDPRALAAYDGNRFRPRFASRLLMRNALSAIGRRWVIDAGFLAMSRWPMRSLAWHVFFGRGSFPDVETFAPEREAWLRTV
jgi:flavin-dependent dehydrogenase